MKARPLFERTARRFSLFTRFLILSILVSVAVGLLLAVGLFSQSQTLANLDRLVVQAEQTRLPDGSVISKAFDAITAGLQAIRQTASAQAAAVIAVAVGLFVAGILVSYAISVSVTHPVEEIRLALDTAAKDVFRFDETIFGGASTANLPAGSGRKRMVYNDALARAAVQDDQDEIAQLAFSTSQLFDKIDNTFLDVERKVRDRMAAVNQQAKNILLVSEIVREVTAHAETGPLDVELQKLVELIAERFGYYHLGVFLADHDMRLLMLRAASGEAGRQLKERGFSVRIGETSLVGYVVISGVSRVVNNVDSDFLYQKEPLLSQTRAEAVFPLSVSGKVIGVLDVQHSQVNCFEAEHEALLQILAAQIAAVIENRRLTASLQQAAGETQTLYQRYIEQSWSLKRLGGVETGFEFDRLDIQPAQRTLPPRLLAELEKGRPVFVDVDQANAAQFGLAPGSTALLAPILMYNRLVGVIGLESDASQDQQPAADYQPLSREAAPGAVKRWGKEEIEVIQALTTQIALAMDNARLLEESQQRSAQLRLLQEVTSAAAAHTDLVDLLNHVTQTLRMGLTLPYCGAIMFDDERQYGEITAGTAVDAASIFNSLRNFKWPIAGFRALEEVIRTGQSVLVADAVTSEDTQPIHWILKQVNTLNLLLVPIIYQSRVIGVLDLHFIEKRQELTGETARREYLRLFDQISLQIASAVEVARSFEVAQDRANRERKVGEVVRHIRETLDIQTILRTAADEIRTTFNLPEVTVRLIANPPDAAAALPAANPANGETGRE